MTPDQPTNQLPAAPEGFPHVCDACQDTGYLPDGSGCRNCLPPVCFPSPAPSEALACPEPAEEYKLLLPIGLHHSTKKLVNLFAEALGRKLRKAELKYGFGVDWAKKTWMDECRQELLAHIEKGDPLDVAAFAAFLWHHGEKTSRATPPAGELIAEYREMNIGLADQIIELKKELETERHNHQTTIEGAVKGGQDMQRELAALRATLERVEKLIPYFEQQAKRKDCEPVMVLGILACATEVGKALAGNGAVHSARSLPDQSEVRLREIEAENRIHELQVERNAAILRAEAAEREVAELRPKLRRECEGSDFLLRTNEALLADLAKAREEAAGLRADKERLDKRIESLVECATFWQDKTLEINDRLKSAQATMAEVKAQCDADGTDSATCAVIAGIIEAQP